MSGTGFEGEFALERTGERLDAYLNAVFAASDVTVDSDESDWIVVGESDEPTGVDPLDAALAKAEDGTIRLVGRSGVRADDAGEGGELGPDEYERTPDGSLVKALLEADAESAPVGRWRVEDGISDVPDPEWLAESPVEVVERSFQPYYDRTAVCIVIEASVETVSEFERTITLPIAVDAEAGETLPRLADWFDAATDRPDGERVEVLDGEGVSPEEIEDALSVARSEAESAISPTVESIRERSTRAANVEFEEYVELQEEKIETLRDERERLSEQLEATAEELAAADDRTTRLEAVDRRSDLRSERERVESELEALESRRNAGFSEKRREIQDRHSIEVSLAAVSVTLVEYEKGDVTLELRDDDRTRRLTVPYGRGVGITEDVTCARCAASLDSTSRVRAGGDGVVCDSCWDAL